MLLALTLLLLGVLLSTRFSVFVLIPVGMLLSVGLIFWWLLKEALTWDKIVFWLICIGALNVGYLLGLAFRMRGTGRADG